MAVAVGTKAPLFTLKTLTKEGPKDVALADYVGKQNVLLLFFPLAFTGVCTQEMCELSAGFAAYTALKAQVFAISVDSPFAQAAWAEKEGISVTLLSDLNKSVAAAYGTLLADLMGLGSVSGRAAFVIDKQGVVRYAEQTPTPATLPDFNAVKRALETLG